MTITSAPFRPPSSGLRLPPDVRAAAWLSDDVLLVLTDGDATSDTATAVPNDSPPVFEAVGRGRIATLRVPSGGKLEGSEGGADGPEESEVGARPRDVETKIVDLRVLLQEHIAAWPAGDRARLIDFLGALQADEDAQESLSEGLHVVREALRERLPLSVLDAGASNIVQVERLHRITPRAFYLEGWCFVRHGSLASLTIVAPEGSRNEILECAYRHPRPDVAEFLELPKGYERTTPLGFIAYFETDAPSMRPEGWVVEARDDIGKGVETTAPAPQEDAVATRDSVLTDFKIERDRNQELRERHIRPVMTKLQELREQAVTVDKVTDHGVVPAEASISIVVPLYGRVDLIEHQIVHFADDPELSESELIYVLDSPELGEQLDRFAGQLHALYRLPFRVVTLTANGGFSLANNLGAQLARGRRLLLLNSDVVPAAPGWLGMMLDFFEATPNIGALAPKLIYEDDAIQHAGLYFQRPPGEAEWFNEHYFKGMHRTLPAANVARPVPAVTAACLMTDSALYERLSGLRGLYVQGDYEDSDFCLRLQMEGLECWYLPQVELYHLEGQSYPSATREASSDYNRWLHTRLWDKAIRDTMSQFTVDEAAAGTIEGIAPVSQTVADQ